MQPKRKYTEFPLGGVDPRRVAAVWSVIPSSTKHSQHVVLPDGCLDLLAKVSVDAGNKIQDVDLHPSQPLPSAVTVDLEPRVLWFGIRFRSAWGSTCLGLPPTGEVADSDSTTSLEMKNSRSIDQVRCTRRLDEFLSAFMELAVELSNPAKIRPSQHRAEAAIACMERCGGQKPIEQIAHELHVSERTLRRDIIDATRLSPKRLSAVFRFRSATKTLSRKPSMSLASLALMSGYCDQSHMNREFRQLTGITPAAMRKRQLDRFIQDDGTGSGYPLA